MEVFFPLQTLLFLSMSQSCCWEPGPNSTAWVCKANWLSGSDRREVLWHLGAAFMWRFVLLHCWKFDPMSVQLMKVLQASFKTIFFADATSRNTLHLTCSRFDSVIFYLLTRGYLPEQVNNYKASVYNTAVWGGNVFTVELLLRYSAVHKQHAVCQ